MYHRCRLVPGWLVQHWRVIPVQQDELLLRDQGPASVDTGNETDLRVGHQERLPGGGGV